MTLDIMMPFYGRIDQFKAAVESVMEQSSKDWLLTIIDDAYPDPTAGEWASSINDQRVRYLRNDTNLGVSGNFRHSVELMQNEHAVIMGCDDIMLPGFVEHFLELSKLFPEATVFQPGVRVIDDDGARSRPLADRVKGFYRPRVVGARLLEGPSLAASLSRGNWAYFPSLIWRVSVLKEIGFRDDLEVALDLALLLEIVSRGESLVLDDRPVFEYRRHTGSVSAFTAIDGTRFVEEREVLSSAASRFAELGWEHASRIARRYLSSRLNAASQLPTALISASPSDWKLLINHILGRPRNGPNPLPPSR